MPYKNRIRLLLILFTVTALGCSRLPERPEGLPELHPCTIEATFGGEPVEDVMVSLKSKDAKYKWKTGGKTDKNGVAKLKTAFAFPGAPEGEFIVSFSKTQERLGNTLEEMSPLSLIPIKYGPGKSTESVVVVKKEKNRFTFALDGGEEVFPVPKGAVPMSRGKM